MNKRYLWLPLLGLTTFSSVCCASLSPYLPSLSIPALEPTPTPTFVPPTPTATHRPIDNPPQRVPIAAPRTAPKERPGLEVVWRGSTSAVSGYRIRYGTSPNALSEAVELTQKELKRWLIPGKENEYRYILENIPNTETYYVQVEAFSDSAASGASSIVASPP